MNNLGVYNETMNAYGPEASLGNLEKSVESGNLGIVADAIRSALESPQSPEADALEVVGMRIGILGVLMHGNEAIDRLEQSQPVTSEGVKVSDNNGIKDIKEFIASFNSSVRGVVVPGVEPEERQKLVLEAFADYLHTQNENPASRSKAAEIIAVQLHSQQLPNAPTVAWLQKNAIETADSATDRLWDAVTELRESEVDRHTQQRFSDDELQAVWREEFGAVRQVVDAGIRYLYPEQKANSFD